MNRTVAPERNRHLETAFYPSDGITPDGQRVALGSSLTQTVTERWCESCQRWIEVRGVLGAFRFAIDHEYDDATHPTKRA